MFVGMLSEQYFMKAIEKAVRFVFSFWVCALSEDIGRRGALPDEVTIRSRKFCLGIGRERYERVQCFEIGAGDVDHGFDFADREAVRDGGAR